MDDRPPLHRFDSDLDWWVRLKPLARQMRHEPTRAEDALWQRLRNRQIGGAKFRRQHAIERFIVDFCCPEHSLILEVDGEIHQYTQEEDAIRQAYLESLGFTVLRFSNQAVMENPTRVEEIIHSAVKPTRTSGSPSPSAQTSDPL
jgi:very-short-patch-repair endonuclease